MSGSANIGLHSSNHTDVHTTDGFQVVMATFTNWLKLKKPFDKHMLPHAVFLQIERYIELEGAGKCNVSLGTARLCSVRV